jgi:hypothetical protein
MNPIFIDARNGCPRRVPKEKTEHVEAIDEEDLGRRLGLENNPVERFIATKENT